MKEAVKALYIGYAIFVIILITWIFISHKKEVQNAKNIENFADNNICKLESTITCNKTTPAAATLFRGYDSNNKTGNGDFIKLCAPDDSKPKKYTYDEIKALFACSYPTKNEYNPDHKDTLKAMEMKALRVTTGYQVIITEEGTKFKKPTYLGPYHGPFDPMGWPTIYIKRNTVLIVRKIPAPAPPVIENNDKTPAGKKRIDDINKARTASLEKAALQPPPMLPETNSLIFVGNQMYTNERPLMFDIKAESKYWTYSKATNTFTVNFDTKMIITPLSNNFVTNNDVFFEYIIYVNNNLNNPVAKGIAKPTNNGAVVEQDSVEITFKAGDIVQISGKSTNSTIGVMVFSGEFKLDITQPEYPQDMTELFQKYTMKAGYNNTGGVVIGREENTSIELAKEKCRANSACVGFTYVEGAQRAYLLSKMGNDGELPGYRVYQKSV